MMDDTDKRIKNMHSQNYSSKRISAVINIPAIEVEHRINNMNLPLSGGKNKGESAATADFLKIHFRGYHFPNPDGYPVEKPKLIIGENDANRNREPRNC